MAHCGVLHYGMISDMEWVFLANCSIALVGSIKNGSGQNGIGQIGIGQNSISEFKFS